MNYEKDGKVYSEYDVRRALPDLSLPETLRPEHVAEYGFLPHVEAAPQPTAEELKQRLMAEVVAQTQGRLDAFAQTRSYTSVETINKYKDFTEEEILSLPIDEQPLVRKFKAEARYLLLATARTWARLYLVLDEIVAGTRPMPTSYADVEPDLPVLEWPA